MLDQFRTSIFAEMMMIEYEIICCNEMKGKKCESRKRTSLIKQLKATLRFRSHKNWIALIYLMTTLLETVLIALKIVYAIICKWDYHQNLMVNYLFAKVNERRASANGSIFNSYLIRCDAMRFNWINGMRFVWWEFLLEFQGIEIFK